MGRQIAIFWSEEKEREFINFLFIDENIVLIYPWSKGRSMIILKELPPKGPYNWSFCIWNKKFSFKPEFTEIKREYRKDGYNYVFHSSGKPVIEFTRSKDNQEGRLYWDKYFTHSKLDYDIEEFEKWYNSIIKWIKKNCKYNKGAYYG
ncbi:hypothetical protein HYV49_04550 [Candidatus Pacearchaeota archaeon]|nr:hypothetical protein [Candidatus Pacearchaeota archaeon]